MSIPDIHVYESVSLEFPQYLNSDQAFGKVIFFQLTEVYCKRDDNLTNALPNPLMSSVKTPGSLSIKHQSPALVAIFNFFSTGSSTCFCCQHDNIRVMSNSETETKVEEACKYPAVAMVNIIRPSYTSKLIESVSVPLLFRKQCMQ